MKKLFVVSAIVLIAAGSSAAFGTAGQPVEPTAEQETSKQLVTIPAPKVTYPIQKVSVTSGPIKISSFVDGPLMKVGTPEMGTMEWMAQEKADKDKREAEAKATVEKLQTDAERKQAELEAEIARLEEIAFNTETLNATLVLVKNQIGKTPWVFSGSTPRAWDCSGLIRWTYAHLNVDLLHSASAQRFAGEFVTEPKIGDLVSFNHRSYGSAYHIGIYVGPDEMLHAGGKPGDRTAVRSISGWQKDNGGSGVKYTRIVETNN